MKNEKEFEWIVKLLNSRFIKCGIFKRQMGGCKKDFEREVGASENCKALSDWLDELIINQTLEFFEKQDRIDYYVINKKRLLKRLEENSLYPLIERIVNEDRVI